VAGVGDVNGDGYADFAYGCPAYSSNAGDVALVFGNASFSVGTTTDFVGSGSIRLGASLTGLGDLNGDGYADFAAGAPAGNAVLVARGANSTLASGLSFFLLQPGGAGSGTSVAGPGDVNGDGYADLLIGAPGAGTGGVVYVYQGSTTLAAGTAPTRTLANPNAVAGDQFGQALSGAGDTNGDGYADFAVGSPGYSGSTGRAYVYGGTGTAGTYATALVYTGEASGDRYGSSLGGGDANGDGYGDLLIGAPNRSSSTGRAYAYYGSPAALLTTPTTTLNNPNNASNDYFGVSVASAGDVNGDGYADLVVGADGTANSQGSAYLYYGSATGLGTASGTTAGTVQRLNNPNNAGGDFFGSSVASAGDVNGDGYADLVVGAYGTGNGGSQQGSAYLYYGSATGLGTSAGTTASTVQRLNDPNSADYDRFGQSVASAGDVNGDGYADLVVGGPYTANGGSAYLYYGSATGLGTSPGSTAGTVQRLNNPNNAGGDSFSSSVASAGDVNGDGYADLVVGAYTTGNGGTSQGSAYLYYGSATGLGTASGTTAGTVQRLNNPNNANNDFFGFSVASAGDVNGDGYADLVVGAHRTSFGQGRTYLYGGNQNSARAGGLRLYNTDYTPISASNRPASQFGLGLTARNTNGRIQARVVWEVVGPGRPFTGSPALATSTAYTGRGAWTNLPASGTAVELRALIPKVGRANKVRARLEYASSPLATAAPAAGTGGPASRVRYGPWTYVATQQAGQSTSSATPLPVVLTQFTATPAGPAAVRLTWATASEQNSAAFEVERSLDGKTFALIGRVAAAGTSSSARSYALLDGQLPTGAALLYYRLKQVDADADGTSYSPVRTVALTGAAAGLNLYPNPTHGAATLVGAQPGAAVTVLDALGRAVTRASADAAGTAALTLPAGLPPGVYVVRAGSQALRLTVE
jgi:hypothetical protein